NGEVSPRRPRPIGRPGVNALAFAAIGLALCRPLPKVCPMRGSVAVENLGNDYGHDEQRLTVLSDVHFTIDPGEFVAITGPSGSWKSTLLALLAGLDRPSRGHVAIDGTRLNDLSEDELSALRGATIGFVFQNFQ